MDDQIFLAKAIAWAAHEGQTRWNVYGMPDETVPYITHPEAIAKALTDKGHSTLVIASAWLHDVIEDTSLTSKDLLAGGINPDIVETVSILTKIKGLSYLDYIIKVKTHPFACVVKMEDIRHNMSDLDMGTLYQKYELALYILNN